MLGHATMSLQRGKVDSEGKLQLPAEMRRALSLSDGDTVLLEMVGGEIHVRHCVTWSRVSGRVCGNMWRPTSAFPKN